jgi:VWFA-related protein
MSIGGRSGVLLSVLLCLTSGSAQQNAPTAPVESVKSDSGAISLEVVVAPKNGQPVAGLTEQDFSVFDNKAPQKISNFRAVGGSEAPVEVILVVDAVNTAYTTIAYEREEIDRFLQANGGHLVYPTQMAIFTDTGMQIQEGFSKDGNGLSTSLDHYAVGLRQIGRSAGFYGAGERLQLSIRTLQQLAAYGAKLPGRKIVLWISPGWPILSGPEVQLSARAQQSIFDTIVSVSTELRQARITLDSIDPLGTADSGIRTTYYQSFLKGIRKPNETEYGNLALEVFSVNSGGLVLNSSNDIAALLQKAVNDTNAYYELSFDPVPGEPNEYHRLDVKVAKPGLVVRTTTGYYSQR